MCDSETDCQANAGCFLDEVEFLATGSTFKQFFNGYIC